MNYFEIGQKIRKYRKEKGLSQEQLAEKVNISVTHMSHIETGNTKLSLPVLVDIATVLQVRTDDLLFENKLSVSDTHMILQSVQDCTPQQIKIVSDIAKVIRNNTSEQ